MKLSRVQVVGLLLLVGGLTFMMTMLLAELTYPGYSVSGNFISDLGATCQTNSGTNTADCVYVQPASTIFSVGLDILGSFVIAAAYMMYPTGRPKNLWTIAGLAGVGVLGVGLVSEEHEPWHVIFAMLMFFGAASAAILSYRVLPRPLNYLALILGVFALIMAVVRVFFGGEVFPATWAPVGIGGLERVVAYPEVFWLMIFGTAIIVNPSLFTRPAALEVDAPESAERAPGEPTMPGQPAKPRA